MTYGNRSRKRWGDGVPLAASRLAVAPSLVAVLLLATLVLGFGVGTAAFGTEAAGFSYDRADFATTRVVRISPAVAYESAQPTAMTRVRLPLRAMTAPTPHAPIRASVVKDSPQTQQQGFGVSSTLAMSWPREACTPFVTR